jgi:molecular chaperone GrpE
MSDAKTSTETENAESQSHADALMTETLSPAQLEDLKARAAKADDHWQLALRTAADLDNYKKRAAREREDAIKFANESLIKRLVPVLDSFDAAMAATNQAQGGSVQSLQTGMNMILQQLRSALAESGLEEVDANGKAFDPNFHEAISQQESADIPEGQVLQQLRKGYKLRDRLIRPSSVVVAKKPAA